MKSLRSEISFNTIASIAVVSALIIGFSIVVYEKLYVEFVSAEVDAIAENLSIDLLGSMNKPAGSFEQTQTLLRLDEYEYVQSAEIFNTENELLASYSSQAALTQGPYFSSSPSPQEDNAAINRTLILDEQYAEKKAVYSLPIGLHKLNSKVVVVKNIGELDFLLGKLILVFNLDAALKESRQRYIAAVTPFVVLLIIISLFITMRIQRRSLAPLEQLISTMDSVVDEKNYGVVVKEFDKKETAALSHAFNNMMSNIQAQARSNQQKTELLQQQQSQMELLANYDSLTGLPNRQLLMKTLASSIKRAKNEKTDVGLMFLDVDGFKSINDSFGHDAGDKFLVYISETMKNLVPPNAVLGRLGGDEFLIIINENVESDYLGSLADKLIEAVSKSHEVNDLRLNASVSIGIASASESNFDKSLLITNADSAMYKAKDAGKACWVMFTPEMFIESQRKVFISSKLSDGLANDNFYLVYQAKIGANGNIAGLEALLRWHDEDLGNISPYEFIPIAEKSDKISLLTKWVINSVCNDLPFILKEFGSDTIVSLNLSPRDLNHIGVTDMILNGLKSGDIPAKNIEFEITETAYMENFDIANSFFEALKHFGCKLALDDFGTGYSSLSYLTEFNIDTLKIDRQFVSQIGKSHRSEQITVTIIEMAKALNFTVCAEGVETEEQALFLLGHGCHMLQGYLYSKPCKVSELWTSITLGHTKQHSFDERLMS